MDLDISRAKELIAERDQIDIERAKNDIARHEAIDAELAAIFAGQKPPKPKPKRAAQKCSKCGEEGHSSRTCPTNGQQ